MKKLVLIIQILLICFFLEAGERFKRIREISLTVNNEDFIQAPSSFFVTDNGMFYVLDSKAANIKIYDNNGKFVRVFGRKGVGPNEFISPFVCAYREPLISISDFGRKTFFIYKRSSIHGLEFIKRYLSLQSAHDIQFIDEDTLLVAGYKVDRDQKEYNFYEYNFTKNKYEFLIPSEISYGYDTIPSYRNGLKEKLRYFGLFHYFDVMGDTIFFVWQGDLKIMKFDRKKKQISSFGYKTENYIQPLVTPQLKKAYKERDHITIWKLWKDFSYLKDIFILNSNKIGVLYFGPVIEDKGGALMLQLYTKNGEFITERVVLNAKAALQNEVCTSFKKDQGLLFILDTETSLKAEQLHKIYEFKIEE